MEIINDITWKIQIYLIECLFKYEEVKVSPMMIDGDYEVSHNTTRYFYLYDNDGKLFDFQIYSTNGDEISMNIDVYRKKEILDKVKQQLLEKFENLEIEENIIEVKKTEPEESYEGYKWIKVKRFNPEDYTTLEERYEALEKHHKEETEFLIKKVRELARK